MSVLSYTGAEKKCDKQQAFTYILYMICGSYFHKCTCSNEPLEKRLYLHYCEMKGKDRDRAEDMAIHRMEQMDPRFLKRISALNCQAILAKENGEYTIEFVTGGFEGISASVDTKGRASVRPVYNGVNWKKS